MVVEAVIPTKLQRPKKVVETSVEVQQKARHSWFFVQDVFVDSWDAHADNISGIQCRNGKLLISLSLQRIHYKKILISY